MRMTSLFNPGTLDSAPEMLIEVSMIADKYQVLELKTLCLDMLKDGIGELTMWRTG